MIALVSSQCRTAPRPGARLSLLCLPLLALAGCGGGGGSSPSSPAALQPRSTVQFHIPRLLTGAVAASRRRRVAAHDTAAPGSPPTDTPPDDPTAGDPSTGGPVTGDPTAGDPGTTITAVPPAAPGEPPLGTLKVTITSLNGSAALPPGVPAQVTVPLSTGDGGNTTLGADGETVTVPLTTLLGPQPGGTCVAVATLVDTAGDAAAGDALATGTATLDVPPGDPGRSFQVPLPCLVASLSVLPPPALEVGTPYAGPLTVQARDASGALIVGSLPFAQPVTLTEGDGSGHTGLSAGAAAPAPGVTLSGPGDVVTFHYDGQPFAAFPIAAGGLIPPGATTPTSGATGGSSGSSGSACQVDAPGTPSP